MTGRVVIVTGASSGIGFQVAQELCGGGNDVILACRHEERAKAAIERIKQNHPSALVTYIHIDLSSLESVRKFVEEFHETGKCAHVLINNAGIRLSNKERQPQYTVDNLELTMCTNYVGHFLLTNLLLEDLKKCSGAGSTGRVINVTSASHDVKACGALSGIQPLDLDNLFLLKPGTYSSHQAYKNSKLANVMFTYELARRLEGTGVTVNAVSPGFVPATDLLRNAAITQRFFQRTILDGVLKFARFTQTIQQAASCIYEAAVDDKYKEVTGKFFTGTGETVSSDESLNQENQQRLWELTAGYCRLEGYPPRANSPPPTNRRRSEGPKPTKDSENTPKKKGKTTPELEKKHKGKTTPEPDKKKEKTTPESEKKIRRLFPWSRAKKEGASNNVEVKEEGKKEKVEKVIMVSDDGAIEVELHESIRAIDLSTDAEEKLGKNDEEKLGQVEEKMGQVDEEKLDKGDAENCEEKPEKIDEVEKEKLAEPEQVSNEKDHIKEASDEISVDNITEHSQEKVEENVEETVEEKVEENVEEKIEEKTEEKVHEKVEQIVEKTFDRLVEKAENLENEVHSEKIEEKVGNGAVPEIHAELKLAE